MMGGMGPWMMIIWGLFGLAVIVLAVIGVIWLLNSGTGSDRRRPADRETPEEILRRRYAAGEISEDEYLRRRSGLREK